VFKEQLLESQEQVRESQEQITQLVDERNNYLSNSDSECQRLIESFDKQKFALEATIKELQHAQQNSAQKVEKLQLEQQEMSLHYSRLVEQNDDLKVQTISLADKLEELQRQRQALD